MKRMRTTILAGLAGLALLGCDARPLGMEQEEVAQRSVLGHLQGRDQKVTIYSTAEGPRFTVRRGDGEVVAQGLSVEQLRERHPDLFRAYERGMARSGAVLDSRLDLPQKNESLYQPR
jgi:hypothetical protein